MIWLILGLALWWAAHLLPVLGTGARQRLTDRVGPGPSKGIMALVIVASVALMVIGYKAADPVNIWLPPPFLTHINNLLMLIAIFLFIAGNMPSPVRRRIRHPQLAATKTWAIAHLLVNGDLPSIILFGGILAWAVLALIGSNRRDGPRTTVPEVEPRGLIVHIAVTVIVAAVVISIHGLVLGVWPLPG